MSFTKEQKFMMSFSAGVQTFNFNNNELQLVKTSPNTDRYYQKQFNPYLSERLEDSISLRWSLYKRLAVSLDEVAHRPYFSCTSEEKKKAMTVFYPFCRHSSSSRRGKAKESVHCKSQKQKIIHHHLYKQRMIHYGWCTWKTIHCHSLQVEGDTLPFVQE